MFVSSRDGTMRGTAGRSRRPSEAGFTLVELLISVTIIGVLASAAIPAFQRYLEQARDVEAVEGIAKLSDGISSYYQAHASMPAQSTSTVLPKWGYAYGPSWWNVCDAGGRATRQDVQFWFRDVLWYKELWDMLQFVPGDGPRYTYQVQAMSDLSYSWARIDAFRQTNCGAPTAKYRRYTVWFDVDKEGMLKRHGPAVYNWL